MSLVGQSNNYIIGTAGHIDHGKTLLVKALTGRDTDRLAEEKKRGISIELGFASLTLPSGRTAAIIDVPGHEKFIKNMLAGIGGIDVVLLIIAADEGVMPQTKEHLDIINLLGINKGIVVLSKIDLVDEEWLKIVENDVRQFVKGTVMENSPIVKVSAYTREGIQDLVNIIDGFSVDGWKRFSGPARLYIDRFFSITGFGTVVTGTLRGKKIMVGDNIEILPKKINTRIRNLQIFNRSLQKAEPGNRVALNLAGVEVSCLSKGDVLVKPNTVFTTYQLDAKPNYLADNNKCLENRTRIRFYLGTQEVMARVIIYNQDYLNPGSIGYVRFETEKEIVALKDDRFIIRSYYPLKTIGGGIVLTGRSANRKRFKDDNIKYFGNLEKGGLDSLIINYLNDHQKLFNINMLAKEIGCSEEELSYNILQLSHLNRLKILEEDKIVSFEVYTRWQKELKETLNLFYNKKPLREGMEKERVRSEKFNYLTNKEFKIFLKQLEKERVITTLENLIIDPRHEVNFSQKQLNLINKILLIYDQYGLQPPNWTEVINMLKIDQENADEILTYLVEHKELIKLSENIFLKKEHFKEAKNKIVEFLLINKIIAIKDLKELLGISRKYALPLLELLDKMSVTKRKDNYRLLVD